MEWKLNYVSKVDLKGVTGVDTSTPASKSHLASLKTKADNLNVNKLKTVTADLSILSSV